MMNQKTILNKAFPTTAKKLYDTQKEDKNKDLKKKLGLDALHLPRDIPKGLNDFYHKFDPLWNEDVMDYVPDLLAEHQNEVWDDQYRYIYREYPKSQKIWLSTTFIFEDIRHALTDAMGMEIMIVAQSEFHAKKHLSDFKKYVLTSEYKDYLITKPIPEIGLSRNEVSSSTQAVMLNPDRPMFPTFVYALGSSPGSLVSFKKVRHIHASDITKAKDTPETQKETWAALLSRVANTKGSIVVEAPFRGMEGPMYEQFEKFQEITQAGIDLALMTREEQRAHPFYCKQYDYTRGLEAGCFTPEFIEGEKKRLGPLFDAYYGAKPVQSDQTWFEEDMFQTSPEADGFFDGLGV